MKGRLFLIPSPLGDNDPAEVIPAGVLSMLPSISTYVVEAVRTARRYLSAAGLKGHVQDIEFHELNEHTTPEEVEALMKLFDDGRDVGLITEAGLPAVADPGAQLVRLCHRHGVEVVPMSGPSSLMLALMASGLNGQSFAFLGYLPAKTEERRQALRSIEKHSSTARQTKIFIETPYRNDSLLADILSVCRADTEVCIAANITMPDAFIRTKTAGEWKKSVPTIGKRPCVFLILGH
ncbi:MAG: SAM-dependent methyltransferase [Candidatus Cryptobacteroides sp.]|nr:SAM-dependent methyltransferase [Bacteroidales bacterium]MDY2860605.1 SAM-dependent methyltransferase [Candidatus Cryptobacteroides sp.]MDD7083568.1 SAM-dependent methyltransferase [Bacteroidales bacterium]MDD7117843.1 SAM-dependent methyltransferase [Bacteroidales bacterium]MDD7155391.1 SAM-dependent methyltransferase [Bacteroidales bacterium]